jgi:aspartate racemase
MDNILEKGYSDMCEKTIGILGGMGPEATADLYYRIVKATPVKRDQDHPRTIVYSNTKVPDRTPAITGGGETPLPEMLMAARSLEVAGADFLVIPCNTAHHFIEELRSELGIPVLHMIEMTAGYVARDYPDARMIGLIATDGTMSSGIYERFFGEAGMEVLVPEADLQSCTMDAIYEHIKKGDLETGKKISLDVAQNLMGRGAELVICGCTEISLVLKDGDIVVPVVDPMQVLAEVAVRVGRGDLEPGDVCKISLP